MFLSIVKCRLFLDSAMPRTITGLMIGRYSNTFQKVCRFWHFDRFCELTEHSQLDSSLCSPLTPFSPEQQSAFVAAV
jgi:hypothetical protein